MFYRHFSKKRNPNLVVASSLAVTAAAINVIDDIKSSTRSTASTLPVNNNGHPRQQLDKQSYKFKDLHSSSLPLSLVPKVNCYCSPLDPSTDQDLQQREEECRHFKETLQHHRRLLSHYKQKWNWHNVTSRIPTTSWPLNIPSDDELPSLEFDLTFCNRRSSTANSGTNTNVNTNNDNVDHRGDRYCSNLQFRIASHMLLQQDAAIQKRGLQIMQKMAEAKSTSKLGHPDAICAYATCLNDGRAGVEPNPHAAVSWWTIACDNFDHIQSTYEIGVALYTGEGVAEDEVLAVEYFRRAAENGHAGASYMLGDCLLDGVGVDRDRGEALEWLVTAADLGHRGARSRVLAVLEKEEGKSYAGFTDASRQTLIENDGNIWDMSKKDEDKVEEEVIEEGKEQDIEITSGKDRDAKEKAYSIRPVTLEHRFTIGGGAKNPVVLARRRTIVTESRQYK